MTILNNISCLAALAISLMPTASVADEAGDALSKCLLRTAIAFEPTQDNMFDLALLLAETECYKQKQDFLNAHAMNDLAGMAALEKRAVIDMKVAIVAARASRLEIKRQ